MAKHGIRKSFGFALAGIGAAFRRERNLRVHALFACLVPILAYALDLSALEHAVLVIAIAAVIAAELFNSAIEATVDLVTEEIRPLAKLAKDVAAGAVLVLAIGSVAVGLLILGPKLFAHIPISW